MGAMFSALRHRNFRLYLTGQFVSLIGTWMQQMATSWLVFRLTKSSLWLGLAGFSAQIPMFLFAFVAGAVADHVNRHKLIIWTQSLSAVQALILAGLAITNRITITEILLLNFALGLINAFDMSGRQSFIVQMVRGRDDLPNAIALNSSVVNSTRLIGPAIAGAAIAAFGEGVCFLLNAVSYLAVLVALVLIRVERPAVPQRGQLFKLIEVGFQAAYRSLSVRAILILLAYMSLIAMPYITLFPALALRVPNGDVHTLGWISTFGALGALFGTLYLASRKGPPRLGRVTAFSGLVFGVALVLMAFAKTLPILLVSVTLGGFAMFSLLASGNTVIQSLVDDDKRGRVMSFFNFSFLGVAPFGSLLLGATAERLGLSTALLIHGILCLIGALYFYSKSAVINQEVSLKFS